MMIINIWKDYIRNGIYSKLKKKARTIDNTMTGHDHWKHQDIGLELVPGQASFGMGFRPGQALVLVGLGTFKQGLINFQAEFRYLSKT